VSKLLPEQIRMITLNLLTIMDKCVTKKARDILKNHSFHLFVLVLLFSLSTEFVFGQAKTSKATFAGGCYWCMEEAFESVEGVISVTSGFTGGKIEAIEILFDPEKTSYEKLLEVFWRNIDPTDNGGQFCDRGAQYRSGIFYHDEQQKALAEKSKAETEAILNQTIVTMIAPASSFSPAKDQDYFKTNGVQYKQYKMQCGRKSRLHELWGENKGEKSK
jgi:peptide methionine sulfoxide reductase MsrA